MKRGMSATGHGNVVRQRRAVGALGLGDGIADPPEGLGLRFVGGDHCILDQALLERLAKQRLRASARYRYRRLSERRFDQHVPACRPRAGCACRGYAAAPGRAQSRGTISNPSMRSVRDCRKRSSSSAARGSARPAQATARDADRRNQPERRRGDDPKRAFRADQQLVEIVAAIVLLQARTGRRGSSRREAPLRRPSTSERIVPNLSTCVPPALVADQPADRAAPARAERQRKALARFGGRSCRSARIMPASATRHAWRDRSQPVHPPQRQDQRGAIRGRRRAADHRRIAALRDQRDAVLGREADDRRDLFGRCRARGSPPPRRESARASRSATVRRPRRSVTTAFGPKRSRTSSINAVTPVGCRVRAMSAALARNREAWHRAQSAAFVQRELLAPSRNSCRRRGRGLRGCRRRSAGTCAGRGTTIRTGPPCGTASTRSTGATRRPTITASRPPGATIRSASSTRCTCSFWSG